MKAAVLALLLALPAMAAEPTPIEAVALHLVTAKKCAETTGNLEAYQGALDAAPAKLVSAGMAPSEAERWVEDMADRMANLGAHEPLGSGVITAAGLCQAIFPLPD